LKRSNTRSRSAGAIPGPLSSTTHSTPPSPRRSVDPPRPGRVLDGVVDQVAQQHAQGLGLARHAQGLGLLDAQVDAACAGQRQAVGHHLARERQQLDRGRRTFGRPFLARQQQELADQFDGPLDAFAQALGGQLARRRVGGTLQGLQLQAQRGQRRAQLMRRIGHEMALRLQALLHPREQGIELPDQGPHLVGQALLGQGRGRRRCAAPPGAACAAPAAAHAR
jgi:hypothetical protein